MLEDVDWLNATVSYDGSFVKGQSPSQRDGLTLEEERQFRYLGAHLVQRAGRLLKMPQSGIMTGQMLLQQFYCQQSVLQYPPLVLSIPRP